MLRTILIGLDGSPYSLAAVELGIRWAERYGARLVGLAVVDEPTICKPRMEPIGASHFKEERDEVLLEDARRKTRALLEQFSLRCSQARVPSQTLDDVGIPGEQIALEAQRFDLVLLGQKTYFHFETQEGPGNTLEEVLRHSPRPVVATPQVLPQGKSVVVAYDGSIQAARSLQLFQALGLGEGREVHVCTVNADGVEAARRAYRAVEFLRAHDLTAVHHPITSSASAEEVILQQVRDLDAGLLVMGAFGHSRWTEFFFGSTTRTVLEQCPAPVFISH